MDIELGKLTEQINREALSGFPQNEPLAADVAAEAIKAVLFQLEKAMATICRRYSKYLMLKLFRGMIYPQMVVAIGNTEPSLDLKVFQVATLAILKYGKDKIENRLINLSYGEVFPFSSSERKNMMKLFELVMSYSNTTKYWKALGGGAQLTISDGYISWKDRDAKQQRIADFENARLEKNNNFLALVGTDPIIMSQISSHERSFELNIAVPVFAPNEALDRNEVYRFPTIRGYKQFLVHYLPHQLHLNSYLGLANAYCDQVKVNFGMPPDEILACLASLNSMTFELMHRDPYALEDFFLNGMVYFPRRFIEKFLASEIRQWTSLFLLTRPPKQIADNFLRSMVLTPTQCRRFELHNGWITSPVYQIGDLFVLDWTTISFFLINIIYGASQNTEVKNLKARQLEQNLRAWILKQNTELEEFLPQNKRLKKNGQVQGEVDVAISKGAIGFLIEAKSYYVNMGLLRGDKEAIETRKGYVEKWLNQAIRNARKLAEFPVGDNYSLPGNITCIIPVVCSTYVEPLCDLDDKHMITRDCPRVCTPAELMELLSLDFDAAFFENEYVFPVVHC